MVIDGVWLFLAPLRVNHGPVVATVSDSTVNVHANEAIDVVIVLNMQELF